MLWLLVCVWIVSLPSSSEMYLFLIRMGGDDCLVAVPQQPGRELHTDLMGLFRGDFSGGKGVDQVIP